MTEKHGQVGIERPLEAIARELCADVEIRVVAGNRVDGLAQVAAEEGADVIVLGSRPRGARGRQLRCTLARELEAATGVPVLIAPPATRKRSGRRLALAEAAQSLEVDPAILRWASHGYRCSGGSSRSTRGCCSSGRLCSRSPPGGFTPRSRSWRPSTSSSVWS